MQCKKCGEDKPESEMAVYAGSVTETCKACRWKRGGGDTPKKSGAAVSSKKAKASEATAAADLTVVVAAGLGFSAVVDGESLVISQANSAREDDDDNITLSKTEAKVLFAQFAPWIGMQISEVAS
jgi:hypothetical protein